MNFCNDDMRIEYVLKYRLNPYSVKGLRLKRQFMRIAKEVRARRCVNVRADQLDIEVAVELVGTEADHATSDNQDSRIFDLGLDHRKEQVAILCRYGICSVDQQMEARAKSVAREVAWKCAAVSILVI